MKLAHTIAPKGYNLPGLPSCANGDSEEVVIEAFVQIDEPLDKETHTRVFADLSEPTDNEYEPQTRDGVEFEAPLVDCAYYGEQLNDTPFCDRALVEHYQLRSSKDGRSSIEAVATLGHDGEYVFVANPLDSDSAKVKEIMTKLYPDVAKRATKSKARLSPSHPEPQKAAARFPGLSAATDLLTATSEGVSLSSTRECVRVTRPYSMYRSHLDAAVTGVPYETIKPYFVSAVGAHITGEDEVTRSVTRPTMAQLLGSLVPQSDTLGKLTLEFLATKINAASPADLLAEMAEYSSANCGLHGNMYPLQIDSRNAWLASFAILRELQYRKAVVELHEMAEGDRMFNADVIPYLEFCRSQVEASLACLPPHLQGTVAGAVASDFDTKIAALASTLLKKYSQPEPGEDQDPPIEYRNARDRDNAAIGAMWQMVREAVDVRTNEDGRADSDLGEAVRIASTRVRLAAQAWAALEGERMNKQNLTECVMDSALARVQKKTLELFNSSGLPGFGGAGDLGSVFSLAELLEIDLTNAEKYLSVDLAPGTALCKSQQGRRNAFHLHKMRFWQLYFTK